MRDTDKIGLFPKDKKNTRSAWNRTLACVSVCIIYIEYTHMLRASLKFRVIKKLSDTGIFCAGLFQQRKSEIK